MNEMIDTNKILKGREFDVEMTEKVIVRLPEGKWKEILFPAGTRILFLRIGNICAQFARSPYNAEELSQSAIEQNLRLDSSFIGTIAARRFCWVDPSNEANKTGVSSCLALNYEIFKDEFNLNSEVPDKQTTMKTEILKTFFDAMNEMIDTNEILRGREFDVNMEKRLLTNNGDKGEEILFPAETRILYLRVNGSIKDTQFTSLSKYTLLEFPFSALEQTLRSHPSFLGSISAHAFCWYNAWDRTIRTSWSSCLAFNYEVLKEKFNMKNINEQNDAMDQWLIRMKIRRKQFSLFGKTIRMTIY
jgi:hypothetical protein